MNTKHHLQTFLGILLWVFLLPALPFLVTKILLEALEDRMYAF